MLTAAVGTECSVEVKWNSAAMGPVVSWTFSSASAHVWIGLSAPSCPNAPHLDPRQWQDWLSGGGLPIWENLSSGVSQIRVHEGARALVRLLEMQSFEPGYRFLQALRFHHFMKKMKERNFAMWLYSMHIWMTSFSLASVWPVATISTEPSGRYTGDCACGGQRFLMLERSLDDSVEEEPSRRREWNAQRCGGGQSGSWLHCNLLPPSWRWNFFSLPPTNRLQSDPWFLGWEVKTQSTMPLMTLVLLVKVRMCIYSGLLPLKNLALARLTILPRSLGYGAEIHFRTKPSVPFTKF